MDFSHFRDPSSIPLTFFPVDGEILRSCNYSYANVTPAGVAALRAALPNCEIISNAEAGSDNTSAATATQAPPLAVAPFTPQEAKQHQQAWADYLGVPVEFENSIGMKMVLIPPGEFVMGSSEEHRTLFFWSRRCGN